MSESTKGALAACLAAGYVLGRGRKAKLAMAVAAYLASKRLQGKPQELLSAGAGRLGDSGQITQLVEQLRSEVLTVGRDALRSMTDKRLSAFADALADRTKSMTEVLEAARDEAAKPRGEEEEEEEEEETGRETGEGEGAEEERAEPGRQRRVARSAEGRTRPRRTRRESEGQQAPAKKTAKKAPPRKAAEKSSRSTAEPSRRRR